MIAEVGNREGKMGRMGRRGYKETGEKLWTVHVFYLHYGDER